MTRRERKNLVCLIANVLVGYVALRIIQFGMWIYELRVNGANCVSSNNFIECVKASGTLFAEFATILIGSGLLAIGIIGICGNLKRLIR